MKFLEQSRIFQNTLAKQSRLFTTIMLFSGVGLVVAAPFLSYEVATIECYDKADNVVVINKGETIIMQGELDRKDQETERLKKQLDDIVVTMDCSGVVNGLQTTIAKLIEELNICEKSLSDCLSNNSGLKKLKDRISKLLEENKELKIKVNDLLEENKKLKDALENTDIIELNRQIKILERRLDACLGKDNGSDKLKNEISILNTEITKLKKIVEDYKNRWELCKSEKRESNNSTFNKLHLSFSLKNGQEFRMNEHVFYNVIDFSTQEAGICVLKHNRKSILAELTRKKGCIDLMMKKNIIS